MSVIGALAAALGRSRRVTRVGFTRLTTKQGPRNYYKGKGAPSTGKHDRKGTVLETLAQQIRTSISKIIRISQEMLELLRFRLLRNHSHLFAAVPNNSGNGSLHRSMVILMLMHSGF